MATKLNLWDGLIFVILFVVMTIFGKTYTDALVNMLGLTGQILAYASTAVFAFAVWLIYKLLVPKVTKG